MNEICAQPCSKGKNFDSTENTGKRYMNQKVGLLALEFLTITTESFYSDVHVQEM